MAVQETPQSAAFRYAFGNVLSFSVLLLIGIMAFSIRLFSVNLPPLCVCWSMLISLNFTHNRSSPKHKCIWLKGTPLVTRVWLLEFDQDRQFIYFHCLDHLFIETFLCAGDKVWECHSWIRSLFQLQSDTGSSCFCLWNPIWWVRARKWTPLSLSYNEVFREATFRNVTADANQLRRN